MPCGKRPLIKKWDKSRQIRVITPSPYEQNEDSVKIHWKKVIRDLELSYKDDQFWESNCDTVRELVGPTLFPRLAKIFNLPLEATQYIPPSEPSTVEDSEEFYKLSAPPLPSEMQAPREQFSMSDFQPTVEEEEIGEEEQSQWTVSSIANTESRKRSRVKSLGRVSLAPSASKVNASKMMSRLMSANLSAKALPVRGRSRSQILLSPDESASSNDDIIVHYDEPRPQKGRSRSILYSRGENPYFEMLYCNESETDMIKWNSKYKQKAFEISASDEFSKKAELMTKQIAKEFYDWWTGLGNVEFKSEIKRPEDIEDLFQVWFDEQASKGLVLHIKILPCVLYSIADAVGVKRASCAATLRRQLVHDIYAETSPPHLMAFGTALPHKMKHIPPNNNTAKQWNCVKIAQDLKTMACVWEDILHLTSTKSFTSWLNARRHLPMPQVLKPAPVAGDKKQLFVVPSDFVFGSAKRDSSQDLALPVSEFSLELKTVLSKLMNQD